MELFKNVNVDWIGKRWVLIGISLVFIIAGLISIATRGIKLGIDFTGGTVIYVKFRDKPNLDGIRGALAKGGYGTAIIQRFDAEEKNEVLIRVERVAAEGEDVEVVGKQVRDLLSSAFEQRIDARLVDLNNVSRNELASKLLELDPAALKNIKTAEERERFYRDLAIKITDYRDGVGLIKDLNELKSVPDINEGLIKALARSFHLGAFRIIGQDSVGPVVSRDLYQKARNAVTWSLIGMLVYIGFRFKPIYGLAAVIAVFHDVLVTLGLFSLTSKEISLAVIAALLTLVGYSVNDTIVIFDRVRENLRLMRRESFEKVVNASINQTLSRTILTSGTVFLSVVSLLLFGGDVLNGFSFALTVGIIAGTYSTLAIAGPIVVFWHNFQQRRGAKRPA